MAYVPGPFDSAHLYAQWGGKLPGGEEWSNGLRLRKKTGTVMSGEPVAMLPALTAAIQAFHARPTTLVHSSALLSFVKLNAITIPGGYMTDTTYQQVVADTPGGGSGSAPPNQVALVVTWETGFSRGPAHSGRIYLPMPTVNLGADGAMGATPAAQCGLSVDTFLTAVNAVSADYEAAVFSRKLNAPGNRRITGCKIGRVLDTQRRRRRSLIEDYQ